MQPVGLERPLDEVVGGRFSFAQERRMDGRVDFLR
jgi:hypothetical protein